MRRRIHPKIIRLRNGKPATYSKTDDNFDVCNLSFNCPTCGKRVKKGKPLVVGSFVSDNNGFHIRHKRFCKEECSPRELVSK